MAIKKKEVEFVEVEADVIEEEMIPRKSFDIDMTRIREDIETLTADIDSALTVYGEMLVDDETLTKMDYADVKRCEQSLSTAMKPAEESRKRLNNDYKKPLDEAKKKYDELVSPIKELHEKYRNRRVFLDDEAKQLRRQSLEQSYEIYAPALVPVVPFDLIMERTNPKWLNRSFNGVKASEELEDAVAKIAKDWETLKRMKPQMPMFEQAEQEFFRTLDLNGAVAHHDRVLEEAERIRQLKEEVAENIAAQEPEVEQEPEHVPAENGVRKPHLVYLDLTPIEKRMLKEWIAEKGIGVKGERFVAEVADRELAIETMRRMMQGGSNG